MTKLFINSFLAVLFLVGVASAQTSWLDRPLNNWNRANGTVPAAPRSTGGAIPANCRETVRNPDSIADRAVTRLGWSLFGPAQVYGQVTLVTAMASVDGMCRPNQFNGFVFVGSRFVGTLSPTAMDARSDASLSTFRLLNATSLMAEFSRYSSSDALCCPSQTSSVQYVISPGATALLRAENVDTQQACGGGGMSTMDNVVSGTVTYRQRIALPQTAVLTVRLVDVSRADAASVTIAEQRIETAGNQVPFSFDMSYDRSRIDERFTYAVQAEIRDGGRLLYITDTSYPVITKGAPKVVDVVVVPVGGGGGGFGQGGGTGSGIIRGTVTYLQRIALGPNSEVRVKLVDSADPNGRPVSEVTVPTNGRQVPFNFELRFEPRDINRQRDYDVWAEIVTDGVVRFRSQTGERVQIRNNRVDNLALTLQPAVEEPTVVTGRTFSFNNLGIGSIRIGTRPSGTLVRSSVSITADGVANLSFSTFSATTPFRGRLIFADNNTLRIAIDSSGNADASGEIEIRYSGNRMSGLTSRDLKLDGQDTIVSF